MFNAKTLALAVVMCVAGSATSSAVYAQVTAPAMAPPMSTGKTGMTPDAKKAKSAECSKQADAKGLHGEARKKFRSECKRG
jgi:hypothetical protein